MAVKLCFLGSSHAQQHLSKAAQARGFELVEPREADVLFVSEDTPIAPDGKRDQAPIWTWCDFAKAYKGVKVLTSQVEPGFTRSLGEGWYHQVELLRMKDAAERAYRPDMIVVGFQALPLSDAYRAYLNAFGVEVRFVTLEEAEFTKIAVNMALASQVNYANRMKAACDKLGIRWAEIANAVKLDKRIGQHAYLKPGRWQDSLHLLRDSVTLENIERA